jgi:hypothetical protein
MGIQVAQAQEGLEKQHGRGPNCGTATKPRQDLFAEQGLNLKQQKSAGEYRQRKWQETPRIGRWTGQGMGHVTLTGQKTSIFILMSKSMYCGSYKLQLLLSTREWRRFYKRLFES